MGKKLAYLLLIALLAQLNLVLAYIDPGTGGMIITSLWSVILAFLGLISAFFIKFFWNPIKKSLLSIKERVLKKNKTERNKKTIKFILLILAISLIALIAYFSLQKEADGFENMKYKKVLIIGIDGMDPRVAVKLMGENKIPNFKKLAEDGSFINLNTSNPPQSPIAWTSIATGVNPGKHNIFDFIKRNPENYIPELSLSQTQEGIKHVSNIKEDAFWKITSKAGISTNIIRWPNTFPPQKVNGKMLSGLGVPDIKGFMSGYSFYTENKSVTETKAAHKVILVRKDNELIETELYGVKTKKGGEIVDVKTPMKIKLLEDSAVLEINGNENKVELEKWSDFIRVKYKVGIFKQVDSVFKAYLISLEPFEMFVTAMQIDPDNPLVDFTYPNKYSSQLAEDIGIYYTLGMPEETDAYIDGRISEEAFLEQVREVEEERDKMFWEEFEEFQKKEAGIYAFVYDSSDRLQHLFWEEKVFEKKRKNADIEINKIVEDYYAEKDEFIREVMEKIPEDTLLLVISDHGFSSFEKAISMNTWLVENNFMKLTRELEELDDEGSLFKYVDWEKTKAYSLGFNSIYINVKGREGKGIIEETDREKVVNEIIEKLESFTDNKTNKKVVNNAYKREDIYEGDYLLDAPDIIVGFNPGYRMSWQTATGGFTKEILSENEKKWKADHLIDPEFVPGVLFSNVKLNKERADASQLDVYPTVLDALGIEIPENIDGKSLLN